MADTMIENGLMVQKANNDRVNGWMALRELLEWDEYDDPRLQIFESCEPIFNGLTTLIHDEKKPEDVMKTIGDDVGGLCALRSNAFICRIATRSTKK